MSDEIDGLKQAEKEKIADWEMAFATEADTAELKAEADAEPAAHKAETWRTGVALLLIALGLWALFGGVHIGFGWWWFFIFLGPWMWGRGGCGRHCR